MWVERHGRTWRIRDRIAGQLVTLQGGFPTKTSAKAAMAVLRADSLRGDSLVPRGGQMTLAEFIDEWWPTYEAACRPSTRKSEGGRLRNHIRPMLGSYTLDELADTTVIRRWITDLAAGTGPMGEDTRRRRRPLSPKSIHNCHGLLHTILEAAVGAKLIRSNPCAATGRHLPAREHREMRFLTDPEIGRLVQAMPEHWRPLILLLVSTGLRWGEAIGLRVGRVDLLAKRPKLVVVEQLQELADTGELVWGPPKTARGRRTVSFTTRVALALAPLVAGKDPQDLVFTTRTGLPVRTRNFRRIWTQACAKAGLHGLRVHDLRHTHAAILISANRPLSAISRRLGHSSIAVTDALYGHLREEVDEGILDAVDESLDQALEDELADELDEDPLGEQEGSNEPGSTRSNPEQRGETRRSDAFTDG